MTLDFSRFKVLTFDCYGTLVDWETGILRAMRPVLAKHSVEIDDRTLLDITYDHPIFSPSGVKAQERHGELVGHRDTSYCGAYWRNGFHEDGVVSALAVCKAFGESL